MVRSSDRTYKVYYDNIIAIVLVVFSLFDMYLYKSNTKTKQKNDFVHHLLLA